MRQLSCMAELWLFQ
jgi:CRP-like cAMP-binding protein